MAKKTYYDWTYNSKNPLRRLSHRTRFKKSIQHIQIKEGLSVLDFGCGDGLFLNQLKAVEPNTNLHLFGFEPYMESLKKNAIQICKSWEEILQLSNDLGNFDYITCFEVMEHFNPRRQDEALQKMLSIAHKDSKIIISVPIEKGPPAVVKTIIRRVNHPHNKHIYNLKHTIKSLFKEPLPEFRSGDGYLSHMGFYFDDLETIINKYFVIEKREFSPFSSVGYYMNSQVFYTLTIK